MSTASRPGLIARMWHRRYELGVAAGVLLGTVGIGATVGLGWLIAAAAAMAVLAAGLRWPRSGRERTRLQTRDGRLPVVLYTAPVDSGERVWLWCRAGTTAGDLKAARDILRGSDVRVVVNDRRSHIVVLEVIRPLG